MYVQSMYMKCITNLILDLALMTRYLSAVTRVHHHSRQLKRRASMSIDTLLRACSCTRSLLPNYLYTGNCVTWPFSANMQIPRVSISTASVPRRKGLTPRVHQLTTLALSQCVSESQGQKGRTSALIIPSARRVTNYNFINANVKSFFFNVFSQSPAEHFSHWRPKTNMGYSK
jgi:hypothetical protein